MTLSISKIGNANIKNVIKNLVSNENIFDDEFTIFVDINDNDAIENPEKYEPQSPIRILEG